MSSIQLEIKKTKDISVHFTAKSGRDLRIIHKYNELLTVFFHLVFNQEKDVNYFLTEVIWQDYYRQLQRKIHGIM